MKNNQKNNLDTLLRKAGMKATPGHLAVLSFIQKSKKPINAQDIIYGIKNNLDPATVYRIIAKLKNNGIIRQIDLRQNHTHYEFFDVKHHHHVICTHCGKIEDISKCNLENIYTSLASETKSFAKISQHSLEFYGLCKKCYAKQQKTGI